MSMKLDRRKYELKKRAERQDETRQRIVEATVALHEELGPAQTSISAIFPAYYDVRQIASSIVHVGRPSAPARP